MIDVLEVAVEIIITIVGVTISDAISHIIRQKISDRKDRENKAIS
jgi:ABC-type phosphate/phosphonate transport system permease subunit